MSIEHPEILLKRLKLGREEYCQRLLTMLVLKPEGPEAEQAENRATEASPGLGSAVAHGR